MWNQKFVKRRLSMMSKDEFEELVPIVLKASSGLVPICVDGSNDGSVDYHLYEGLKKSRIVVQTTDTWQNLERKIRSNVDDVSNAHSVDIYYYIVKEVVSNDVKERLETYALDNCHLTLKILGGNEIADFIIRYNLQNEFSRIARLEGKELATTSIEQPEVLLHSYLMMSTDRRDLTNEMSDSTLKFLLFDHETIVQNELIEKCLRLLQLPATHGKMLMGRIDSLMSKGIILRTDNSLALDENESNAIRGLIADYNDELLAVSSVCCELMGKYGAKIEPMDDIREFATLLARCYVEHYCEVLRDANYDLKMEVFSSNAIASASHQLKARMNKLGVPSNCVDTCYCAIVRAASNMGLIKRLAQSVVYVALREFSAKKSPAVFNTDNWSNVNVYIDASVLMPYLISKLFDGGASNGDESRLTVDAISACGCSCYMPSEYLEEISSHLIAAKWYSENQEGFEDTMESVPNAYVSIYYRMKHAGIELPSTLSEYLKIFCDVLYTHDDYSLKYEVINSLSKLLREYNVNPIRFDNQFDESDESFSLWWESYLTKRKVDGRLIRHDVSTMKNLRHKAIHEKGSFVLLTWDNSLLKAEYELKKDVWVVTPVDMADLVCIQSETSDYDLMSLSHSIASVMPQTKEMVFGRILEKIIMICRGRKLEWKCRQEIISIKGEFFKRYEEQDGNDRHETIQQYEMKTMNILKRYGITEEIENDDGSNGTK